MRIKFEKMYLKELYETGRATDKKHRFRPDIVLRYKRRIDTLADASCVEALYSVRSLHYEELKGDKAGRSSVRVNDKYRVEFTVSSEMDGEMVITVCNITELSNHYK
jgi:proteic killer suppression protein